MHLSAGEQQRAALARAMAAKPKLVLMDEPFSNLDPQLRDQMRDLTLCLLRENGAAGLIVTHDAADALRMADRIAVQNKGRILQIDTPEAIYQNPLDLHVAAMFGPVMVSFPVAPLIVMVSVPLVNELAVRAANVAVVPDPTLIMRLEVPAAVSVSEKVSAVS